MNPSVNCYEFIRKEEGCRLSAYLDSASICTIGIGSTMYRSGARVKLGETISMDEAMDLLEWEVGNKAASVSNFVKGVLLTQNNYDALLSFAYNCGIGALQNSTLLKKVRINPKDISIKDEFLKWDKIHVNGKVIVSKGLFDRRMREWLFYSK